MELHHSSQKEAIKKWLSYLLTEPKSHDLAVTPSNVLWPRLRYVAPPRSNTLRLVQKELAVAGRCFCVLIDGDDDRLHMLIAPAFPGRETTSFFESP
jgi:hypothetical protein